MSVAIRNLLFPRYFRELSAGRKTALLGVFIALSVVANIFSIDISPSQKIAFTYLVGFFSGTLLGGPLGFIVCFFADLIAFLLPSGGGVYWPLTGICTGLLAFIPGIVMNLFRFPFRGGVYFKTAIAVLLTYLCVTCTLGAFSNYLYVKYVVYAGREYTKAFFVYLAGKIGFSTIVAVVNYALVFCMIPVLNSIKNFPVKIE